MDSSQQSDTTGAYNTLFDAELVTLHSYQWNTRQTYATGCFALVGKSYFGQAQSPLYVMSWGKGGLNMQNLQNKYMITSWFIRYTILELKVKKKKVVFKV